WSHFSQMNPKPEEEQAKTGVTKTSKASDKKAKFVAEEVFDVSKGPAKIGSIHIRVMKVELGPPAGTTDRQNSYMLKLQIENKGTAKVDYKGWSHPDPDSEDEPVLVDSAENKYKRVTYGVGILAEGQVIAESIHAGKWVNDMVVFEMPPDNVAFVK